MKKNLHLILKAGAGPVRIHKGGFIFSAFVTAGTNPRIYIWDSLAFETWALCITLNWIKDWRELTCLSMELQLSADRDKSSSPLPGCYRNVCEQRDIGEMEKIYKSQNHEQRTFSNITFCTSLTTVQRKHQQKKSRWEVIFFPTHNRIQSKVKCIQNTFQRSESRSVDLRPLLSASYFISKSFIKRWWQCRGFTP